MDKTSNDFQKISSINKSTSLILFSHSWIWEDSKIFEEYFKFGKWDKKVVETKKKYSTFL